MKNISFSGINNLSLYERRRLRALTERYYERIEMLIKNTFFLNVHIKCHDIQGRRKKYSLRLHASAPGSTFISSRGIDWDPLKAMHKAFEDIERQARHRYSNE